jgi:hypothetical protein
MSLDTVFMQVVFHVPFSVKNRAQPTGNFKFLKQYQKLVAKFAKAGDKDIKVSRIQLNKRITVPPMSTIQRTVKLENDFDTDVYIYLSQ